MKHRPTAAPLPADDAETLGPTSTPGACDELPPPPATGGGPPFPLLISFGTTHDLGDYELLEEIDRGGMGVVYRAHQKSLDRIVAVKMIRDGALAGPEDVARFHSEAAAAARLRHPQIVAIHEVGIHDGRPFFSMDYIEGCSLAEYRRRNELTPRDAASLVRQIALAVQAAHDHGILHRDLKPSNVLIDAAGAPHVADFGLAKRIVGGNDWTVTGQVLGTPSYMSPEQALGRSADHSFASDVFALGAILYELLIGRPPFEGDSTADTLRRLIDGQLTPPRRENAAVSVDLDTICLKCLERQPEQRYQTARELADELDRFLHDEPIRARPLGSLQRTWRWCRRNPALATVMALVCVLAVAGPAAAVYMTALLQRAEVAEVQRNDAEIQALRVSSPEAVPQILTELRRDWPRIRTQLRKLWDDPQLPPAERTRLSVALADEGPPYADHVFQQLQTVSPDEFRLVCDALPELSASQIEQLWNAVADRRHAAPILNAAAALARFDPNSPRWETHAVVIGNQLIALDSQTAHAWAAHLEPARNHLIPTLAAAYTSPDPTHAAGRALATELFKNYSENNPQQLVEWLSSADARQFGILAPVLLQHGETATDLVTAELQRQQQRKPGQDTAREQAIANLAILLLRGGRSESVWDYLDQSPDSSIRTYLIHRLTAYLTEPELLIERLEFESRIGVRRALILALGEADPHDLPPALAERATALLDRRLRTDPDVGTFSAALWTLRQWGRGDIVDAAIAETLDHDPHSPLNRYFTPHGQLMGVVRGPVEFQVGNRRVRIERSFAYALTEVTRAQYLEFEGSPEINAERGITGRPDQGPVALWHNASWSKSFGPDPQCPHIGMPWLVAARYCRWLTEREGMPPAQHCFLPRETPRSPVTLNENYLSRTGYRLPTAAEWEYLCRAGAVTERFYGRCDELIGEYAWCAVSSQQRSWPVGMLKPNDLGLFDIHGNIREWTLTEGRYPLPAEPDGIFYDRESSDRVVDVLDYVITGSGCYSDQTRFTRATPGETKYHAEEGVNLNGMRLVRTISQ